MIQFNKIYSGIIRLRVNRFFYLPYCIRSSLDRLPPVVPAINVEAWKSLSNISQKLNCLTSHLNAKSSNSELTKTEIFAVKKQIKELRLCQTASMNRYSYEGMLRPLSVRIVVTPLKNSPEGRLLGLQLTIKFFLCFYLYLKFLI